jgi:hypothetical protein
MEAKRNGLQRNAQQELYEQLGSLTTAGHIQASSVTSSDRQHLYLKKMTIKETGRCEI